MSDKNVLMALERWARLRRRLGVSLAVLAGLGLVLGLLMALMPPDPNPFMRDREVIGVGIAVVSFSLLMLAGWLVVSGRARARRIALLSQVVAACRPATKVRVDELALQFKVSPNEARAALLEAYTLGLVRADQLP